MKLLPHQRLTGLTGSGLAEFCLEHASYRLYWTESRKEAGSTVRKDERRRVW